MSRTLVLAIGNDLRGDDRLAFDAIRLLKEHPEGGPSCPPSRAGTPAPQTEQEVNFEEAYAGGLELLELMEGYDRVLLLDSLATRSCPPGTLVELQEGDLQRAGSCSPHYVTLPEVVDLAKALGIHFPAEIRILGLETEQAFEFRSGLSPTITAALPGLVARAKCILKEWSS